MARAVYRKSASRCSRCSAIAIAHSTDNCGETVDDGLYRDCVSIDVGGRWNGR